MPRDAAEAVDRQLRSETSVEIDRMILKSLPGGRLRIDEMIDNLSEERYVEVLPFPRRNYDALKEKAFRAKHRRNLLVHLSTHLANLRFRQWEYDFPEEEAEVMHKVRCAPLPWIKQHKSCENNALIEDLYGIDYCEHVLDELRAQQQVLQHKFERANRNDFRASHDLACGCPGCQRMKNSRS